MDKVTPPESGLSLKTIKLHAQVMRATERETLLREELESCIRDLFTSIYYVTGRVW